MGDDGFDGNSVHGGMETDTNRLRLVLEGSRPFGVGNGGLFTPTFDLGLRRDGGDAEEGSGVEIGCGLLYASPHAERRGFASRPDCP